MNRILKYLRNYRLKAIMAPIFKCLEAIFELLVPMAVASMIDIGIGRGDTAYIFKMGAVLLLLAAVGFMSSLTAQWFSARAAAIAATSMRYDLLRHISGLSYADIDNCGTERLLTSMTSDINQVQNGINMFLRLFMRSPFIVFGAAVMAFSIDKKMSLIFVLTIFVLTLIVFGILLGTVPLYKKVQCRQEDITGLSKEQISGAQVIRAFNREENNKKEFIAHNRLLTDMQIYAAKISSFMNPATMLILNAALVLLIWKGALNIEVGGLTKGSLVALINYMGQILTELIKFANLIILISKAVASDKRIEEMFAFEGIDRKKQINEPCADNKTLLELKNVSFTYPDSQEPTLCDISFKINKGEYIGIIGGTGSGKSTLAKLLAGLYSVSQGRISFNSAESSDTDSLLRKYTTYVPQKPVIIEGSILENILMGRYSENEHNEELIQKALEISQAAEFVNGFDDGVMHHAEQGGRNLSGGQKQRLCIARGICMDRPVLILDDPASALDFATERALRRELKRYKEEKKSTVIVISQRAAMVRNADRIIVMNDGHAEAVGTHEELFESNETYHEICLTQEKNGEVSL